MTEVVNLYQGYIQELHAHLYDNQPFEQVIQHLQHSHRRKRFVAMYLIQSKVIFYSYYERRKEFHIEPLFNQIIAAMLSNTEQNRLKQWFVDMLELTPDMIAGKVTSYEIKVVEKDLNAFSFYQTKKELKSFL